MRLIKIRIKNFRSFGEEVTDIPLENEITGIIGTNSAGKTTLLESFRKMFGISNSEKYIVKSDFHIPFGKVSEDIEESELFIEAVFKFDSENPSSVPEFFEHMIIEQPGSAPIMRVRLTSQWNFNPLNAEGDIETKLVYLKCLENEPVTEENTFTFPRHKRSLIQSFYVPAIRKPSEQIKFISGSILFRLFQTISWTDEIKRDFGEKLEGINTLFQGVAGFENVQTTLSDLWNDYNKDTRYNSAALSFGSNDINSMLKKMEIAFSPTDAGRPYHVGELGEGYRSLFYLTLVSTLLRIEDGLKGDDVNKPYLTLLLIEEPENHIAPQLLGRVLRNLKNLSQQSNVQVILSSHTPSIISRINPEAIRHLRICTDFHKTIAKSIVLPDKKEDAYKFVKEAVKNYPEIYFSKLVVLGEGDSEEVIFKRLSEAYEEDFDDNHITVAPLGGRFVNHIWKLLNQLDVPHVTLLDLDRGRGGGGGWGRIKYVLKQLILNKPQLKKELLKIKGGVLKDDRLEGMHKWDNTQTETMKGWIKMLEKHSVFFSYPLDLDFMMLQKYTSPYQDIAIQGPQIPNKVSEPKKFEAKKKTAVAATLKSESATGVTYSEAEKELMIWYNYLFLGRGKPSTHIMALSKIDNKLLKADMPAVLDRMFKRIKEKID